MRPTSRALAKYLTPGTPTGLTGLWTHNSPRSTLLFLYNNTLERLKTLPETSLYRQSVEAQTKHRMNLVNSFVPPGHEEWTQNARGVIKDCPDVLAVKMGNKNFVVGRSEDHSDPRIEESDGEPPALGSSHAEGVDVEIILATPNAGQWELSLPSEESGLEKFESAISIGTSMPGNEGSSVSWTWNERPQLEPEQLSKLKETVTQAYNTRHPEGKGRLVIITPDARDPNGKLVEWQQEPQLTAEQVADLEVKIGAGLIEEVIQVAEGELKLIEVMQQSRPWEALEEKPVDGQWTYFERQST